jgi:uncharacterized membrane protein HdeD (DUF308 family)
MKSFFRNFRYSTLLVSILCMGLGALVLLKPDNTMKVLTYGFGGVLILAGIIQVVAYLMGERKGLLPKLMLLAGIMSAVVGVWMLFTKPDGVRKLAMIVLGVVLLYHGFMDIKYGFDIKGCQAKGAAMAVFFGVATCAVGVLMLVDPFKSEGALLPVAGLGFLFDGITDFITVFTLAGAKVHYDRLQSAAPVIELEPGAAHTVHVDGNTAETPVLSQPEADAGTAEPEDVPAAEPVVVTAPAEELPSKPAPEE